MRHVPNSQPHPARSGPQLGTWRLQSFITEYHDNGLKIEPYGARPGGFLHYGSDGRMNVIIAHENRKPPVTIVPTDAEKVALFDGFAAYAGTYTIDGETISHHVDTSWNEAWTGTTQVRRFRIEGNLLYIRSVPEPDFLDGRVTSSQLIWIKVE